MSRYPFFRICLLSALILICSGFKAGALEAVLTEDSTFSSGKLRKWDAPHLLLSERDMVILRFDLESVLPTGTTSDQIAKATLRVWVSKVWSGGYCGVYPITNSWREHRPEQLEVSPLTFGPASAFVPHDRAKGFMVVDVTSMVRDWVSGTPNFGIALQGARPFVADPFGMPVQRPALSARIDSKENIASSHLPTLQIILSSVPPVNGN